MGDVIKSLLGSRKFWMTVSGVIVAVSNKWGLKLPADQVLAILALIGTLIVSIAWEDAAGKKAEGTTEEGTKPVSHEAAKAAYQNPLEQELYEIRALGIQVPSERVLALMERLDKAGEVAGLDVRKTWTELREQLARKLEALAGKSG